MTAYIHLCKSLTRPKTPDSLELKLQAVLSCETWVLGIELGSSAGAPNY